MSDLKKAAFLAKKLRVTVSEGATEEQQNAYWAGYSEGLLMYLAARIPEVRKELEERLVYQGLKL